MLRGCALLFGALLCIAGAVLIGAVRIAWPAGVEMLVIGALVIASVLFERHYRTRPAAGGHWETTGERFIDPASGKLMQVRYNPTTGQRVYEEVDSAESR